MSLKPGTLLRHLPAWNPEADLGHPDPDEELARAPAFGRALQALRRGDLASAHREADGTSGPARPSFDEVLSVFLVETAAELRQAREDQDWLLERADWSASLFRVLPMAALVLDRNLLIVEVNDQAMTELGLTAQALRAGMPLRRLLAGHDMSELSHRLQGLQAGESLTMHDLALRTADGKARCADVHISLGPSARHAGQRAYVCAFGDRTDRAALQRAQLAAEQAERRREMAEAGNQAKSQLLSRVSHELRTPLNAVLGFSQLLMMTGAGATAGEQHKIRCIYDAGRHLLELVDEILELNQAESGRLQLAPESVSLHEVAAQVIAHHVPAAEPHRISLRQTGTLDAQGRPIAVWSDRRRVVQVLNNLVTNAIKYNRPDGEVEIRVEPDGQHARVAVRDTGIGIGMTEEQLQHLFEPFNRLGAEHRPDQPGFGLGLSIAQSLCRAMGSELEVESRPGLGTVFQFRLPQEPMQVPAQPSTTSQ